MKSLKNIDNIKIKTTIDEEENKINNIIEFTECSKVIELNGREIGFYNVEFINNNLTIEYCLFAKYRNLGLGRDFVKIVIDLVEKEYIEYNVLYVRIKPENIASIKVAKANGFKCDYYDEVMELLCEGDYMVLEKYNSSRKHKKY